MNPKRLATIIILAVIAVALAAAIWSPAYASPATRFKGNITPCDEIRLNVLRLKRQTRDLFVSSPDSTYRDELLRNCDEILNQVRMIEFGHDLRKSELKKGKRKKK